ncbi:MAG: sulfotransferase [Cryomorphaceae bacterium]|nr:hypothetical protein [Flavobacteriales bacterium]
MKKLVRSTLSQVKKVYMEMALMFRKPTYTGKVFCIGYNKTGTTTIGKSLEMLGYRNSSFNKKVWRKYYKKNQIDKVLKYTARFDSFDDLPWLKEDMIPILDREFPNSKFIYLTRDEESWQQSLRNWKLKTTGAHPDLAIELEAFRKHKAFVLDYFKDRSADDFIILDVRDKKGFKKLAEFLGQETEREAFPHFNETKAI